MNQAGRHRTSLPPDPTGAPLLPGDGVEARLLGERRSMRQRDVSAAASVSLRSARKFWDALGLPDVGNEDTVFTDADLVALQSVANLVRDGVLDEHTALAMTRAFARTTDRLAVLQTQLMAEAMGGLKGGSQPRKGSPRAGEGATLQADECKGAPDPATAQAVAEKLADIADDLEPLLIYAWRRHLSAAILRVLPDVPVGSASRAVDAGDDDDVGEDEGDVGADEGDVGADEGDVGP